MQAIICEPTILKQLYNTYEKEKSHIDILLTCSFLLLDHDEQTCDGQDKTFP